ncbi:MAG: hypothetical protein ACPGEG_00175 [Salibacteraceae bacterium]
MKLKLIMLSLTTALISFTSSAQEKIDSNIKWSENIDRQGSKGELIIDENEVLTKLYYNAGYLKVQKIDAENEVETEKDFHYRKFTKGASHLFMIKTNNFINLICRHKEMGKFVFRHSRINLTSLEVEIRSQELFSQDYIREKNVPDVTLCVSPDESKFFIGHHNYSNRYKKEGVIFYTYVGNIFDATGAKINSGEVELEGRKVYVRRQRANPQITNEGVAFFRHEYKNKVFQLRPNSSQIEECPISKEILKFNPSFNKINNIKVLNGDKNYVCFTYSEKEDRRFLTGMVICELLLSGEFKILTQFRMPSGLIETFSNTEYETSRDCIRETENEKKQLFNWKVSDFEKLDDIFVLILEYNHMTTSHSSLSVLGETFRHGEIVVFKFNSGFKEYDYHIIPKLFTGACGVSNCEGLLSTANISGYSLFNFNSKIILFYWGNSKNEIHTNATTTEKREIFHIPTDFKDEDKMCMYKVEINSSKEPLHFYNLGSYMSTKYPLLLNQGVRLEENIYFRAQKRTSSNDYFKVARYTF